MKSIEWKTIIEIQIDVNSLKPKLGLNLYDQKKRLLIF